MLTVHAVQHLPFALSEPCLVDLQGFVGLVEKWNRSINLIAPATLPTIWDRHVVDSLQLWPLAPAEVRLWVDLGSGGGFPGLPLAILAKAAARETEFRLVESDRRKATFLREAARVLNLKNVTVLAERVESLSPQAACVVSARALSSLGELCGHATRHLRPGGVAIFPKGAAYEEEVRVAREAWAFDLSVVQSLTEPAAALLRMENLHHV